MPHASLEGCNILIIDDEPISRVAVTKTLGNIGVGNVSEADNGNDALRLLETADPKINVIICDIEMPEMTGYEFVRRVRYGTVPEYAKVPIIILTGKDTDKNLRDARIHKINDFLLKPPTAETLKTSINRVLAS